MSIVNIFAEIWTLLKENMSAIALLIFNFEEYKVMRANREKADALLALELKGNKDAVDAKYAGKSDLDIVNSAIIDGGGGDGQLSTNNEIDPTSTAPAGSEPSSEVNAGAGSQEPKKD